MEKLSHKTVMIPMVGVLTIEVLLPQSVVNCSRPVVVAQDEPCNLKLWDEAYVLRGATTSREKRRMDKALAIAYESLRVPDRSVVGLLQKLAEKSRDTPLRRHVLQLTRKFDACATSGALTPDSPEWEVLSEIISVKCDVENRPKTPSSLLDLASDAQLAKFLSKYPFEGAEDESERVAISKFCAQESKNALTNKRWLAGEFTDENLELISSVTEQLGTILGQVPTPDEIIENSAWGPGTVNGYGFDWRETGPELKFGSVISLTPNLLKVAPWVVSQYPRWASAMLSMNRSDWFSVESGDKLFTVPKRFGEHRCAMKQPMMNIWLSRGVGVTIRNRLLTNARVKLQHQPERNKELARIGSATGLFCTLDLTSASDSVCRAMLRSVLDPGWFAWLYATASRSYTLPESYAPAIKGRLVPRRYEMMSSMGCGFTFELESALFLAISRAVVPAVYETSNTQSRRRVRASYPHIGVFGDDIIVPNAYARKMIAALELFGFSVNPNKSFFSDGPGFRESCGGDYWHGVDVRPYYLQNRLDDGFAITNTANTTLNHATRCAEALYGNIHYGAERFRGVWTKLASYIPSWMRPLISVPRSCPQGLWTLEPEVYIYTSTAQPVSYKVIERVPYNMDLSKCSFIISRDRVNRASGENLMAARLSNLTRSNADECKWSKFTIGTGERSTLRELFQYRIGTTHAVECSRWRGWMNV